VTGLLQQYKTRHTVLIVQFNHKAIAILEVDVQLFSQTIEDVADTRVLVVFE
jgi:hypothetical protein